MDYYSENTQVFKALGDPKRAMIINLLTYGELCACDILEKFEMSQSTLSHHMKILRECGLVKGREVGKWTYYSLDEDIIGKTKQFFDEITAENENKIHSINTNCCMEGMENE